MSLHTKSYCVKFAFMKVFFLVGLFLWHSLQVFFNHRDNSDRLVDMQQVYCLGPSCKGWKQDRRQILPYCPPCTFCLRFYTFFDRHCHHIYCPFKNTHQIPVYFFPLCLASQAHTLIYSCLSNLTCFVLPTLSDILKIVQFESPPPALFFGGNSWLFANSTNSLISILSRMRHILLQYFKLNFLMISLAYGKHQNTIKDLLNIFVYSLRQKR